MVLDEDVNGFKSGKGRRSGHPGGGGGGKRKGKKASPLFQNPILLADSRITPGKGPTECLGSYGAVRCNTAKRLCRVQSMEAEGESGGGD